MKRINGKTLAEIVCALVVQAVPVIAQCPTPNTIAFVEADGDRRAAISGERVVAIYGLKEDSEYSLSETDDFVAGFLADNDDAFGVDDLTVKAR